MPERRRAHFWCCFRPSEAVEDLAGAQARRSEAADAFEIFSRGSGKLEWGGSDYANRSTEPPGGTSRGR
jgi:hypothetical protein